MIDHNNHWYLLQGSRYPEIIRNYSKIPDNETPEIPDRNRRVNESQNKGSRYPEFRLTRPYCTIMLTTERFRFLNTEKA